MTASPADINLYYLMFISLHIGRNGTEKAFSPTLFGTQLHGLKKIRNPNGYNDNITYGSLRT